MCGLVSCYFSHIIITKVQKKHNLPFTETPFSLMVRALDRKQSVRRERKQKLDTTQAGFSHVFKELQLKVLLLFPFSFEAQVHYFGFH